MLEMLRKDDLIKILHAKNYIVKITFLDDNFYVVAVTEKKKLQGWQENGRGDKKR